MRTEQRTSSTQARFVVTEIQHAGIGGRGRQLRVPEAFGQLDQRQSMPVAELEHITAPGTQTPNVRQHHGGHTPTAFPFEPGTSAPEALGIEEGGQGFGVQRQPGRLHIQQQGADSQMDHGIDETDLTKGGQHHALARLDLESGQGQLHRSGCTGGGQARLLQSRHGGQPHLEFGDLGTVFSQSAP